MLRSSLWLAPRACNVEIRSQALAGEARISRRRRKQLRLLRRPYVGRWLQPAQSTLPVASPTCFVFAPLARALIIATAQLGAGRRPLTPRHSAVG
eukprot:366366-Chlamydomonas_euryale.AAC.12